MPGGSGFGDPAERDPEQVALDVADGLISRETAERDYRIVLDAKGTLDRTRRAENDRNEPVDAAIAAYLWPNSHMATGDKTPGNQRIP